MKQLFSFIGALMLGISLQAQVDSTKYQFVKQIFEYSLTDSKSYEFLDQLCNGVGPRLSGSEGAEKAVTFTDELMTQLGFDSVFLQEVMVPNWKRGDEEYGYLKTKEGESPIHVTALGGSVKTDGILEAEIVEVQNFGDLERLGKKAIKGKIVFYNRPMNPVHLSTFTAYGGGVDQRWKGAQEAAKYGAVGVLVRSLTLRLDTLPHTGSMAYADEYEKIPAAAVSTVDAEEIHKQLVADEHIKVAYKISSYWRPDTLSHNVIGELKGNKKPEEYIVVGGHLDSWDLGTGAHDDGAGVAQSIEALRLLKALGYTPKHTLRTVLFMNEENGLRGGKKYAELAEENKEYHVMAVETDAGGSYPEGFRLDGTDEQVALVKTYRDYLEDFDIFKFKKGGSGADISPLKNGEVFLAGLSPNSQRYFDYHHAASDVTENVNPRELQLGAAALAAFIYLVDQTFE